MPRPGPDPDPACSSGFGRVVRDRTEDSTKIAHPKPRRTLRKDNHQVADRESRKVGRQQASRVGLWRSRLGEQVVYVFFGAAWYTIEQRFIKVFGASGLSRRMCSAKILLAPDFEFAKVTTPTAAAPPPTTVRKAGQHE